MERHAALFKVNEELAELVTDIFETRDFHPKTYARTVIIFFVAKAYKTLRAIMHLCSQGYGEDAGILLRSLFEIAVNALYIKDDEELAKKFADFEAIRVHKLSKNPKLKDVYGKLSEERLREIREAYEKAQVEHKYTSSIYWSGKNIKEMAEEVGFGRTYAYIYDFLSQFIHSNVGSAGDYIQPDPDRPVSKVKLSPSDNLIPENMLTAGALVLDIVKRWNEQFNLGIETKIAEVDNRLIELKDRYVRTRIE